MLSDARQRAKYDLQLKQRRLDVQWVVGFEGKMKSGAKHSVDLGVKKRIDRINTNLRCFLTTILFNKTV